VPTRFTNHVKQSAILVTDDLASPRRRSEDGEGHPCAKQDCHQHAPGPSLVSDRSGDQPEHEPDGETTDSAGHAICDMLGARKRFQLALHECSTDYADDRAKQQSERQGKQQTDLSR
jgi:hypothetical protein